MSRQVTELDINDVVKEGEAVQMKQFLQVSEYAIIDKTKKGMHPTDERYLFDWKKMCKLSPEAQAFYRKVELGLEKQTKGWLQLDPKDTSKKEKQFKILKTNPKSMSKPLSGVLFRHNLLMDTYNRWSAASKSRCPPVA